MREFGGRVAALVLAAGASLRMGKPKQLLLAGERSLLEIVLTEALESRLEKVVLILGYKAKEIQDVLQESLIDPKLTIVENKEYGKGISSSILVGLLAVEKAYDHVMIILADMPHISSRLIDLLLDRYQESGLPLGAIQVGTRRTHPVIFSRKLYPELHQLKGDVGARELFETYKSQACLVEASELYDDRDIDTPQDYMEFQKSLKKK